MITTYIWFSFSVNLVVLNSITVSASGVQFKIVQFSFLCQITKITVGITSNHTERWSENLISFCTQYYWNQLSNSSKYIFMSLQSCNLLFESLYNVTEIGILIFLTPIYRIEIQISLWIFSDGIDSLIFFTCMI